MRMYTQATTKPIAIPATSPDRFVGKETSLEKGLAQILRTHWVPNSIRRPRSRPPTHFRHPPTQPNKQEPPVMQELRGLPFDRVPEKLQNPAHDKNHQGDSPESRHRDSHQEQGNRERDQRNAERVAEAVHRVAMAACVLRDPFVSRPAAQHESLLSAEISPQRLIRVIREWLTRSRRPPGGRAESPPAHADKTSGQLQSLGPYLPRHRRIPRHRRPGVGPRADPAGESTCRRGTRQ